MARLEPPKPLWISVLNVCVISERHGNISVMIHTIKTHFDICVKVIYDV